jgi:hypothetical protein
MKMLTYDLNFGYCHRPFGELWYMSSNRTLSIQTILLLKKSTLTVSRSLGEKMLPSKHDPTAQIKCCTSRLSWGFHFSGLCHHVLTSHVTMVKNQKKTKQNNRIEMGKCEEGRSHTKYWPI